MTVIHAENGETRTYAFLNEHPNVDLVLMDIMMPQMDGWEVAERDPKTSSFQRTPHHFLDRQSHGRRS